MGLGRLARGPAREVCIEIEESVSGERRERVEEREEERGGLSILIPSESSVSLYLFLFSPRD